MMAATKTVCPEKDCTDVTKPHCPPRNVCGWVICQTHKTVKAGK